MTHKKPRATASIVRSSAAEYLTFVAASGQGGVEAVYADENVWLSQKMMGQLYDVETPTINYHLKTIFSDSELQAEAVIRSFRITALDGRDDFLLPWTAYTVEQPHRRAKLRKEWTAWTKAQKG